jgi:hypothetical protein
MNVLNKLAFAATFLLLAASPAHSGDGLASFAWMAGGWGGTEKETWTEEWWTPPRANQMMGSNRTGEGEQVRGFEFMRITQEPDGTITFWGAPGGVSPVPFKLKTSGPEFAVFENPDHDFPNWIRYERTTEGMKASIGGAKGGEMSWTWSSLTRDDSPQTPK